jgi:hypothetical protein
VQSCFPTILRKEEQTSLPALAVLSSTYEQFRDDIWLVCTSGVEQTQIYVPIARDEQFRVDAEIVCKPGAEQTKRVHNQYKRN